MTSGDQVLGEGTINHSTPAPQAMTLAGRLTEQTRAACFVLTQRTGGFNWGYPSARVVHARPTEPQLQLWPSTLSSTWAHMWDQTG
mmetsp:Transcript_13018/g.23385  ORF Transcript_13018/g.23385 Transcript_13018/m.23385 type:complete len:86 (+) Transcript_13018:581-838(+)